MHKKHLTTNKHFAPATLVAAMMVAALALTTACGHSSREDKEKQRASRMEAQRNDSLMFKVATLPTLDCLPVFVAERNGMFKAEGVDVKVVYMKAQMDADEALMKHKVDCSVTDVMRAERMRGKDASISYLTATNAYWQLIANRKARVKQIRQLGDKMIAMTRYSATDYLTNVALDSVKTENPVFRIQVNDVIVRLRMLQTNAMDAMFLTEPQATVARTAGHEVLMDSRDKGVRLGAFVARVGNDALRKKQAEAFKRAYNRACDSINGKGLAAYASIIAEDCLVPDSVVRRLPSLRYDHVSMPRQTDLAKAKNVKWRTN